MNEAKFIYEARKKAGLTQIHIADKLGYSSAQFISNAERGLCTLPDNTMHKFVKITGSNIMEYIEAKITDYRTKLKPQIKLAKR